MEMAESGDEVSSSLKNNEFVALKLAQQISLTNKGVSALSNGFEDLYTILTSDKKMTAEFSKAVTDLDKILSDVLTIDAGTLSREFLTSETNLLLMKEAAEGNIEAFEKLRTLAAQDIVVHAEISEAS
jgi:hypothetical protein